MNRSQLDLPLNRRSLAVMVRKWSPSAPPPPVYGESCVAWTSRLEADYTARTEKGECKPKKVAALGSQLKTAIAVAQSPLLFM